MLEFQSLVGKLETMIAKLYETLKGGFQSLVGKLETKLRGWNSVDLNDVSIPCR